MCRSREACTELYATVAGVDGARRESDEGDRAAGEGAWVFFDTEEACEIRLYPGGNGRARRLWEDGGRCGRDVGFAI
jgi:hypothetical protein